MLTSNTDTLRQKLFYIKKHNIGDCRQETWSDPAAKSDSFLGRNA